MTCLFPVKTHTFDNRSLSRAVEAYASTIPSHPDVWPMRTREATYFTQVGDSRGYLSSRGELRQLMRDQTAAQALIDQGLMAAASRAISVPL